MKANLQYGSDYLKLANYYKKHGDQEQSIKVVWEGLENCDGRLDEIYSYLFNYYKERDDEKTLEELYKASKKKSRNQYITELMHQYYEEKKNYEKQKETLISLLECNDTREFYKLYQQCKNELSDEDFIKEERKILSIVKKRSIPAYFDILMDKNETKEVIEYITQNQQYVGWGIDQGHRYSKKLSAQYPREFIELYWKEAASYIRLGKEFNYKHAASVLKEIRQIMNKNNLLDEWESRYSLLLQEHSRKKLLLKELENLKL